MLHKNLSFILFTSLAVAAPACSGDDGSTGGSGGSTGGTSTSGASTSTSGASTGDTGTAGSDTGTAGSDTGTGGASTGGATGTTGGAGVCATFCADFIATCDGVSNNYGSEADCVTACEGMTQEQVDCRVMHLGLAQNDAATHCPHADLDGGGVCP